MGPYNKYICSMFSVSGIIACTVAGTPQFSSRHSTRQDEDFYFTGNETRYKNSMSSHELSLS